MLDANNMLDSTIWKQDLDTLFARISDHYVVDEETFVGELVDFLSADEAEFKRTANQAAELVREVREMDTAVDSIDELLQQYSLDTNEGLMLMCLAEAMLRIPDKATADALIEDKLGPADWKAHVGKSESWFVNASTWGLLMTGRVINLDKPKEGKPAHFINKLVNRMGEPVIRRAMYEAMKIMGKQFVLGRDIEEALKRSKPLFDKGYTYSYDMLGEAARTREDAKRYFDSYADAIKSVGKTSKNLSSKTPSPSISIKLSALHPRYEFGRREQILEELVGTVCELAAMARDRDVAMTIDAEEVDRLELSLEVFRAVYESDTCRGWGHFGLVVQAYAKRALPVLHYINRLADQQGDEIPMRLVKGAYWDTEVKECQQIGVDGYPVYTRKASTDVAYLVCANFLLSESTRGRIFPQFATHNAHTISTILELANDAGRPFEFQRLHGMGEALYDAALKRAPKGTYCRIYAPVGAHKDLLPYLVRRLLENGANSSFVHQLVDPRVPIESLCVHPVETLKQYKTYANNRIPLPKDIYGPNAAQLRGVNLNINSQYQPLMDEMATFMDGSTPRPLLAFDVAEDAGARHGTCSARSTAGQGRQRAVDQQGPGVPGPSTPPGRPSRAGTPRRSPSAPPSSPPGRPDGREPRRADDAVLPRGGKLLTDGVDEIREAVDFCRYYAVRAEELFGSTTTPAGPHR